jgi:hypothetical protein
LTGAVLSIDAKADRGPGSMVDYELTVPSWMPLKLGGMYAQVTVEGSKAPIEVETLEGDISSKAALELLPVLIQARFELPYAAASSSTA